MVASNPSLITTLGDKTAPPRRDYRSLLRSSTTAEKDFSAELSALRRAWAKLLVEIGEADAEGKLRYQTLIAYRPNWAWRVSTLPILSRGANLCAVLEN